MAKKAKQSNATTVDSVRVDKRFNVPVYGGRVLVFRSVRKMNAALSALGLAEQREEAKTAGICMPLEHTSGVAVYVIGLFDPAPSVLVHEVTHLALCVAERAGYDPINEQEPLAYLIEELFGIISGEYD